MTKAKKSQLGLNCHLFSMAGESLFPRDESSFGEVGSRTKSGFNLPSREHPQFQHASNWSSTTSRQFVQAHITVNRFWFAQRVRLSDAARRDARQAVHARTVRPLYTRWPVTLRLFTTSRRLPPVRLNIHSPRHQQAGGQRDRDQQRAQAELEPAAAGLWGLVGHGRKPRRSVGVSRQM